MLFSFGAILSVVSLFCGVAVGYLFGVHKYWLGCLSLLFGIIISAFIGRIDQSQQIELIQIAEDRAGLVEAELDESKNREGRLQTDLSDLAIKLDVSRNELASVSLALEDSRSREERLEGSVSSLSVSLSESRDREILLGDDVAKLRADNLGLRSDLKAAQGQIIKLLENVEAVNAESVIIRETVESQSRAQQQSELRQTRGEHCELIGSTVGYSRKYGVEPDRKLLGQGECFCGQYFRRNQLPDIAWACSND